MSFGDIRVADRADWLIDRIAATGSVVLRRVGETRAGERAAHRFLSSPHVDIGSIIGTLSERTAAQCAGGRVLVVQDTTEVNFAGRAAKRRGFGPGADGRSAGFFIHPVIAVDLATEAMVGLVAATIWSRAAARVTARRSRALEDKESMRWLAGCEAAAERLSQAGSVVMVADRESDIYSLFARRPERLDLIVRAAQDRALQEGSRLFAALAEAAPMSTSPVQVAPRGPGDKGRIARVELRAATVRIARPHVAARDLPATIELNLVEVREPNPPAGKPALLWRLLTTLPIATAEQAGEVVQFYRLRWRIEQTFRALKSDGLALEDSQIVDAERMFNLAALALAAAIRTIQLVDARDGSPRQATDVLDEALLVPLQHLSKKLEGKTPRQKNPHPPHSLAFIAWVTARLGGWNCYYKPPGPKTMREGWNQLAARLEGYLLALESKNA